MTPEVAADIPQLGDARRKNWAKVVYAVDASKASGWAYEGEFIATGGIQDVPVGSVVLVYGERGSRGNPESEAAVFLVNSDGTLTQQCAAKGRAWARTIRDEVEALLDQAAALPPPGDPQLSDFSDVELATELERRGYTVVLPSPSAAQA